MNLTYLVTAWARKIEDEHRLLWRALGTLKRFEALDPADCEGDLRYQEHKIPIWVADMSEHSFNLVDLWSVLENQMRLGFIVVATVELDTEFGIEAPLVLDATVRVGQSDTPSERRTTAVDVELRHTADETAEEGDEYD
jgi:hypothetical protein